MFFPSGLPLLNIIWFLSTGLPPSQKRLWMPGFRFEQNKCFHMLYMVKIGHIYIHMYNLLTILVYMHTYLYIHTTSSYMSHKVHDTKSNSEDYMITLNKRKTNSRTTVSKVNKPSISTNSKHIEVQTI
jgi:hypothetical protein